jgi:hypothetical protein
MDIHKPEILVIMETRVNPKKLSNTFKLLGFDQMQYSECRDSQGA